MSHDAICENMVTIILCCLIGIPPLRFRRIEQRQSHRAIVGLVPSIPSVIKQCHPILPRTVGKIRPLVSIYLEEIILVVSTTHISQSDVVSRLVVGHVERKLRLEQGIRRTPVHLILHINPLRQITFIEVNPLHNLRSPVALPHHDGVPQRPLLDRNHRPVVNRKRSLVECCFLYLPRRPLR